MIRTILLLLCSASLAFGADKPKYTHVAIGDTEEASFAIPLKKDTYQALLEQIQDQVLEINLEAIVERIKTNLADTDDLRTTAGDTVDSIARELAKNTALPVLEIRVEKFNELLNSNATKDQVSAGFLAFSGLAKGMESSSKDAISGVSASGTYHYSNPNFKKGRWEWWDSVEETSLPDGKATYGEVLGTTAFHRNINGSIEEEIEFDLKPYGSKKKFSLEFSCEGEVKIEQANSFRFVWRQGHVPQTKPIAIVRIQPIATVTASKTVDSGNSCFRISGSNSSTTEETFEEVFRYPAIMEFRVEAKKL